MEVMWVHARSTRSSTGGPRMEKARDGAAGCGDHADRAGEHFSSPTRARALDLQALRSAASRNAVAGVGGRRCVQLASFDRKKCDSLNRAPGGRGGGRAPLARGVHGGGRVKVKKTPKFGSERLIFARNAHMPLRTLWGWVRASRVWA